MSKLLNVKIADMDLKEFRTLNSLLFKYQQNLISRGYNKLASEVQPIREYVNDDYDTVARGKELSRK